MDTLAWDRHSAVAVARKRAFNYRTNAKEQFFCFDKSQNIRSIGISMVTKHRFDLLPEINRLLRYSLEAGLFVKWERDSSEAVYSDDANAFKYKRIMWKHFCGALIHLCIGLLGALIVFGLEIVINRRARARRRSKLWKVTERLIDGHRYEFL